MTVKKIGLIIIFFFCANLIAQNNPLFLVANDWEKLSEQARLFYLLGMRDGSRAMLLATMFTLRNKYKWDSNKGMEFSTECEEDVYFPLAMGATFDQISSGIDELYKDYANRHIPIFAIAALVVKRIQGGIKTDEVEPFLQKLRKTNWGK